MMMFLGTETGIAALLRSEFCALGWSVGDARRRLECTVPVEGDIGSEVVEAGRV